MGSEGPARAATLADFEALFQFNFLEMEKKQC